MAKIYYTLIYLLLSSEVFSASCCGGGQSAASLMVADHLQEWTFSTVYRSDLGQTNNDGKSLFDDKKNTDHTFSNALEYKRLFDSRLQGNASLVLIEKSSKRLGKKERNSGLGDLSIGGFYEAFTSYYYEAWLPRIFFGTKVIIPFGENNFNSKKDLRTDIRGTGFYKVDFPIVLIRNNFKVSATPQYFPDQKYLNSTYAFATAGTFTQAISSVIDISSTVQWNYLEKKQYQNQTLAPGQYWEVSVSPSWTFDPSASLNLNYSDTTLLGKSRNSALFRAISLGITWSELI